MKKYILLLLLLPALLHGANLPDSPPLISWSIFPDGVQAVDGSTVVIVANGIYKEISLNGNWPEGKQGKQLLADLISGKRTDIRIYGKDEQCRDVAVLLADGENVNEAMMRQGFKQQNFIEQHDKCNSHIATIKDFQPIGTVQTVVSERVSGSGFIGGGYSGTPSSIDTSGRTQRVRSYTKQNGTHVESYLRSPRRK
jgi:hypothetical protein